MKTARKVLLLVLCAALLVSASVMGTLAYLQSQSEVAENTFTVGQVHIKLDEAKVNSEAKPVKGETVVTDLQDADRVLANSYKLMPGLEYTKDPTVYIKKNSEEAYVRMIVTLTNAAKAAEVLDTADGVVLLQNYVDWNADKWVFKKATADTTADTITYEFRYYETVAGSESEDWMDLEPLFTKITMPDELDNTAIAKLDGTKINVKAHAIQVAGFETEDAAWAKFVESTATAQN